MACSSSLEDSSPSAMKACLWLSRHVFAFVLSRQAYVAKTSDQFCHVSTRHAFKIWEDTTKTCDVIKRGKSRLQRRPCLGGLYPRTLHYKERSSSAILVKNKVFLQNHGLNELKNNYLVVIWLRWIFFSSNLKKFLVIIFFFFFTKNASFSWIGALECQDVKILAAQRERSSACFIF
jgi:hypothetical protein